MDVYWIGGGSGAGKSTVARRLAARHGLRLYDTDAVMTEHARRSDPATSPQLAAFLAMSMDERWLRPAFDSRGSTWQIAARTSDPERALAGLLERDGLFTDRLRAATRELGLTAIDVGPGLSEDHLTALVEDALGLKKSDAGHHRRA